MYFVKETSAREPTAEAYREEGKRHTAKLRKHVFEQAAKLAAQRASDPAATKRKINRLFHIANEALTENYNKKHSTNRIYRGTKTKKLKKADFVDPNQRYIAPVERAPQTRYNLRGTKRRPYQRRYEELPATINRYILDYVEKIRHKKEALIEFLTKMYRAGYVYREASKKFARPRR
jgi:hypothetical protein